jgi:hypothetical protein
LAPRDGHGEPEALPPVLLVGGGQREQEHEGQHGGDGGYGPHHRVGDDAHEYRDDEADADKLQQGAAHGGKVGYDHGFHRDSPFSISVM